MKYLIQGTKQKNRGVNTSSLAMCNCMKMKTKASILIECAFMTNLQEAMTMVGNDDYWEETAVEIARGICEYTGVTYINEETIAETTDEYIIQAGAFTYKVNAEYLVDKLKCAGFTDAFIYTTLVGGNPLYRVQLGVYHSIKDAERIMVKAKAYGFKNVFIQYY